MILNCESLQSIVKSFSLVEACDVIKSGAIRIATPFYYPNGSQIDLFIQPTNDLFGNVILTDLGQTADYVADMQFNLWATKKRRTLLDDICNALDVAQSDGSFYIRIASQEIKDLPQAIVRLAQACIRATDLIFTQRLQNSGTFQEEVEEFLASHQLPYEPDLELTGRYQNVVNVDFKVQGRRISSLVETLSTRANTHVVATEVFRRWYDLEPYRMAHQFMTIYDEAAGNYKDDDLKRLSEYSAVFGFPKEQEQIYEALAA
jgi:hypothetical protein